VLDEKMNHVRTTVDALIGISDDDRAKLKQAQARLRSGELRQHVTRLRR
jgi:hypothetical protein